MFITVILFLLSLPSTDSYSEKTEKLSISYSSLQETLSHCFLTRNFTQKLLKTKSKPKRQLLSTEKLQTQN